MDKIADHSIRPNSSDSDESRCFCYRFSGQLLLIIYTCGGRSGCRGGGYRSFDEKWFGASERSAKGSSPEGAENTGRRRGSVFSRSSDCGGSDGCRCSASCSHMSRMTRRRRHDVNRRDRNTRTRCRRRGRRSGVTASERRRSQRLLGFSGGRWTLADAQRHVKHFLVKG